MSTKTYSSNEVTGWWAAVSLLCGNRLIPDQTEREDEVPANN